MAFTSDGSRLVVGGYHELLIWDPAAAKLVARVGNIPQRTLGLAFNADSSLLAVAGGSPGVAGEVRLIPWQSGPKRDANPKVLATQDDVFFDVAFRPDGKQLVAGGADGSVRVFDLPAGVERLKISGHSDWVTAVCYSPDGKLIATASRDKTAKVFDAKTGNLLATHSGHDAPVRAVAFAPDGKSVISAGGGRIRIWSVQDSKLIGEMTGFENDVYALLADGENVVGAAGRSERSTIQVDRPNSDSFAGTAFGMGLVARLAPAVSSPRSWLLRWHCDHLGFGKWDEDEAVFGYTCCRAGERLKLAG